MARISSDLITLLPLIQAQIVTAGVIPRPELAFISLADDETFQSYPPDDQFVVIGGTRFLADQPAFYGGGNVTLIFSGPLAINLWGRVETDIANQDADYLTNSTLGLLNTFKTLMKSLSEFEVLDANGNQILEQPLRILSFDLTPRRKSFGWGRIGSLWQLDWQQTLS